MLGAFNTRQLYQYAHIPANIGMLAMLGIRNMHGKYVEFVVISFLVNVDFGGKYLQILRRNVSFRWIFWYFSNKEF